ncbi:MAG: MerR family transcriptional regulator [Chloroflexota bacterium]|nr:MerR family transcriptional regulator [Chloroflexota bacterium]
MLIPTTTNHTTPSSDSLRIGELARKTGTGKATIKHYLILGLLEPSLVENQGYRRFDTSSTRRIAIIKQARLAGFGLPEIRAMFDTVTLDELAELLTSLPAVRCRQELRIRGVDINLGESL